MRVVFLARWWLDIVFWFQKEKEYDENNAIWPHQSCKSVPRSSECILIILHAQCYLKILFNIITAATAYILTNGDNFFFLPSGTPSNFHRLEKLINFMMLFYSGCRLYTIHINLIGPWWQSPCLLILCGRGVCNLVLSV